jgi:hypothetical protein
MAIKGGSTDIHRGMGITSFLKLKLPTLIMSSSFFGKECISISLLSFNSVGTIFPFNSTIGKLLD